MSELTKEYFEKHTEELHDFLSQQFAKLATKEEMQQGLAEQSVRLDFLQADIAVLRKDLAALAKRTKEDDAGFTKELLKLKSRVDALVKQIKRLKPQHT